MPPRNVGVAGAAAPVPPPFKHIISAVVMSAPHDATLQWVALHEDSPVVESLPLDWQDGAEAVPPKPGFKTIAKCTLMLYLCPAASANWHDARVAAILSISELTFSFTVDYMSRAADEWALLDVFKKKYTKVDAYFEALEKALPQVSSPSPFIFTASCQRYGRAVFLLRSPWATSVACCRCGGGGGCCASSGRGERLCSHPCGAGCASDSCSPSDPGGSPIWTRVFAVVVSRSSRIYGRS